jgi:F-type H+-transporting ATPase subunit delta
VAIALGEERGIQEELNTWESMIASSNELRQVIDSPTITLDEKRRILTKLIERVRPRPTTANFIQVLLQNHRLGQLAAINQRFAQVLDERSGVVAATVTTARPMDGISQDTLQANLAALTGKKVRLSFETDEDLIGGLVTRIGSTIYDGSVRNQLQQARERLMGN